MDTSRRQKRKRTSKCGLTDGKTVATRHQLRAFRTRTDQRQPMLRSPDSRRHTGTAFHYMECHDWTRTRSHTRPALVQTSSSTLALTVRENFWCGDEDTTAVGYDVQSRRTSSAAEVRDSDTSRGRVCVSNPASKSHLGPGKIGHRDTAPLGWWVLTSYIGPPP